MANQYINKVIYGGRTLIDLTNDDVSASTVLRGITFHLPSGLSTTGVCDFTVDATDADAQASEILNNKKAAVGDHMVIGTMPNRGAQVISITTISINPIISNGYHDGSGYATIDSSELAKLIPGNIRQNVTVLGITGTMSSEEGVNATTATIIPSLLDQTIVPPTGYNYFTNFTVKAIVATSTDNAAGGVTYTIAGS